MGGIMLTSFSPNASSGIKKRGMCAADYADLISRPLALTATKSSE